MNHLGHWAKATAGVLALGQLLPAARAPRFLPIIPQGAAAVSQSEETLADLLKATPDSPRGCTAAANFPSLA